MEPPHLQALGVHKTLLFKPLVVRVLLSAAESILMLSEFQTWDGVPQQQAGPAAAWASGRKGLKEGSIQRLGQACDGFEQGRLWVGGRRPLTVAISELEEWPHHFLAGFLV